MVRSGQALTSKATCNKAIYIPLLFEIVDRSLSEMWFLSSVLVDSIRLIKLHTAKMHTLHSSEVVTAATTTEVTLHGYGSKQ